MPQLTPHAKAITAGVFAVLLVGLTSYQSAEAGHFRWVDLIPVAVAVVGAIQTKVIPNTPELPWAKGLAAGAASVLGVVATFVANDPSDVTAAKVGVIALGGFLVWWLPELAPEVEAIEPLIEQAVGRHEAKPITVNISANTSAAAAALATAKALADAIPQQPRASSTISDDTQPMVAVDPAQSMPSA